MRSHRKIYTYKKSDGLTVSGQKKRHAHSKNKKASVAIVVRDDIHFKTKSITSHKKELCIWIKG